MNALLVYYFTIKSVLKMKNKPFLITVLDKDTLAMNVPTTCRLTDLWTLAAIL